jgi:hypothetical protein
MSKGIVILATNTPEVNYASMACLCSDFVRNNLSKFDEIAIVTNTETYNENKELIDKKFDRVIIDDYKPFVNVRMFKDTTNKTFKSEWNNHGRSSVYDLSPYDETLVIDSDYFVMSNTLDQVWGSQNDFMINSSFVDLAGRQEERLIYIDEFTIPMYWATVFYFKKSQFSETLFTLINHIRNNYKYYCLLYNCPSAMFRNDFVFSIALHIINGNVANNIPTLPFEYLNNSFDLDDIHKINSYNEITMLFAKKSDTTDYIFGKIKNMDIHIMNKKAIIRHLSELLNE